MNKRVIVTPFLPKKLFAAFNIDIMISGIGRDAVSKTIEEASGKGYRELLFIGSCGGILNLEIGDIVLPETPSSKWLLSELEETLLEHKLPFKKVKSTSVNSMADESVEYINTLVTSGINCVDMEFSFFLEKATALGIEAAGLLYVTDLPHSKPFTEPKSSGEKKAIINARQKTIEIICEVAKQNNGDALTEILGYTPGINKKNELNRLLYEISRREKITESDILNSHNIKDSLSVKDMNRATKFSILKDLLIQRRFPSAHSCEDFNPFLTAPNMPSKERHIYTEPFSPEKIFIESASENTPLAKRVVALYPETPLYHIESVKEYRKLFPVQEEDPKKRDLIITKQLWDFVKRCPCTKEAVYCGYNVINLGFGCPFDCTYCYLQHYSNSGGIMLDSNVKEFLPKIDEYLSSHSGKTIRIGTGEFTDSLALDHITEYSKTLVPFFADKNVLFELKTKSINIGNLEGLDHNGKTVIGWSLNPQTIVTKEEHGAASLINRLEAAKKCEQMGYKIAFHFDPVIHYHGWESDYKAVIGLLFDYVKKPEWISVGTIRFHRSLKGCIEKRFPETDYIYGEMILGPDKKIRYTKALREEISKKMVSWIKQRSSSCYVYLCMETKEMWKSCAAL